MFESTGLTRMSFCLHTTLKVAEDTKMERFTRRKTTAVNLFSSSSEDEGPNNVDGTNRNKKVTKAEYCFIIFN